MAPAIAAQFAPEALQRSHSSVVDVGLFVHEPAVALSVCACSAIPEIDGGAMPSGLPASENAPRPIGLPTPVGPS